MNRLCKLSLWITIIVINQHIEALVIPYLSFRSQGINDAREIAGWQTFINRFDMDSWYGTFSITPEYTRSFRTYQLADYLWCDALAPEFDYTIKTPGCCNDPLIRIQGTKVPDRRANALMAENFYLPTDFKSDVHFRPVIENFLIDFNVYIGLDNLVQGMFFRIHTPICRTSWALNMQETIINPGTNNYDPGYFNDTFIGSGAQPFQDPNAFGISRTQLLKSFSEYIQDGKAIEGVTDINYEGLAYARISRNKLTKTRLAEITAAWGWNFLSSEDYHFNINIRGAAPTGNRPQAFWLFEPIVGNGHHWELGAGVSGHVCLGRGESEDKDLSFYIDAYFTHLFNTRQCRTFDLCGNPLSRYMLAMKFTDSAQNLRADTFPMPFANARQFTPVANLTTIPVKVSALFQGEFLFKFAYTVRNLQLDLGFDLWARSCENIQPCDTSVLSPNLWALKGDAFTYGFPGVSIATGNFTIDQPGIALSASESKATIFTGTNNYPFGLKTEGEPLAWNQNPGIDNPQQANNASDIPLYTHQIGHATPSATDGWDLVRTSSLPQFFDDADLGINRASTKSYSLKFFSHLNYTFACSCWTPFIGIGGELEFGDQDEAFGCSQCRKHCCNSNCATDQCPGATCCTNNVFSCDKPGCTTCSLSQWGVWIKGGFAF